jgi:hypothetical protein
LTAGSHDFAVDGSDVVHHVRLRADRDRCSCPWFSKLQGERGPCKSHPRRAPVPRRRDGRVRGAMNEPELSLLWIARRSLPEIIDTLLALPIAERRALAPMAARLWREVDGGRVINDWLARLPGASTTRNGSTFDRSWRQQHDKLSLAVLALCPDRQGASASAGWALRDSDDTAAAGVCRARRGLARRLAAPSLRDEFPGVPWAFRASAWCATEAVRRPDERDSLRGYLRLMVSDLNPGWSRPAPSRTCRLSARLLADPGLLDDEIWRLFDTDTNAFDDAWTRRHPQSPADYESWSDALVRLAGAGRMSTASGCSMRVSPVCGRAATPASSRVTTSCTARLAPGADELDAREAPYRELLGHRSGAMSSVSRSGNSR